MEVSIKIDIAKPGWSIVYIDGSQISISKKKQRMALSLKIDFVWQTMQIAVFHVGFHCMPHHLFIGFLVFKGLNDVIIVTFIVSTLVS